MKHSFTSDDVRRHWNGPNLPPLRTITEMAQEFGVSRHKLAAHLGHDPASPKPRLKHTGAKSNNNTWYNPQELRKWWKTLGIAVSEVKIKQTESE